MARRGARIMTCASFDFIFRLILTMRTTESVRVNALLISSDVTVMGPPDGTSGAAFPDLTHGCCLQSSS
jgi:hypothetical protein